MAAPKELILVAMEDRRSKMNETGVNAESCDTSELIEGN